MIYYQDNRFKLVNDQSNGIYVSIYFFFLINLSRYVILMYFYFFIKLFFKSIVSLLFEFIKDIYDNHTDRVSSRVCVWDPTTEFETSIRQDFCVGNIKVFALFRLPKNRSELINFHYIRPIDPIMRF